MNVGTAMSGKTQQTPLSAREFYKQHPWCGLDTPEAIAEHHRALGMNEYADAFMELVLYEDKAGEKANT